MITKIMLALYYFRQTEELKPSKGFADTRLLILVSICFSLYYTKITFPRFQWICREPAKSEEKEIKANELLAAKSDSLTRQVPSRLAVESHIFSSLFYKTVNCFISVILKCSIFQISIKSALVNHFP